jgi:hypothetical protein
LSPAILSKLERLAAADIRLLPVPEIETYFVLERGGYMALVERTPDGFGRIGSAGLLTEKGFAALVWRGPQPFFAGKEYERAAGPEEVAELRAFQADLGSALA